MTERGDILPALVAAERAAAEFRDALARAARPALATASAAVEQMAADVNQAFAPFLASVADLPDPPRPFIEHPPTLTVRTIPYYVPVSTAPCVTCGATVAYNLSAFADPWHVQPSALCWSPWPARPGCTCASFDEYCAVHAAPSD